MDSFDGLFDEDALAEGEALWNSILEDAQRLTNPSPRARGKERAAAEGLIFLGVLHNPVNNTYPAACIASEAQLTEDLDAIAAALVASDETGVFGLLNSMFAN